MNDHTRYLWGSFLRALPWLVGVWVIVSVGIALLLWLGYGVEFGESLRTAITFLPLAVPLTPLVWLRRQRGARTPKALPAIGLSVLWAALTFPLAIGAALLLGKVFGVD